MKIVPWPPCVPKCVLPLSAQGGPQDNRHSFETDSGHAIERPRASWAPDVFQVEIAHMSRDQFETFETWFRYDLAFGANAFTMAHPITGRERAWKFAPGEQPYTVRKERLMRGRKVRGLVISARIREVFIQ